MRFIAMLLAVAVLSLTGCGDSPTPPDPQIAEGFWTGSTSFSDPLSFTVAGDSVTSLELRIVYTFPLSGYVDTITWNPASAHISNNVFSMTDSVVSNPAYTLTLNGTFTPPDQVSGEVSTGGTYHPDSSTTDIVTYDMSWTASHSQ